MRRTYLGVALLTMSGCAGLKVINPNEQNKEEGTRILDWSGGQPKIESTFSCQLKSGGKRFSAIGKTEEEARKEVLARCHDGTVISFCQSTKINCFKN